MHRGSACLRRNFRNGCHIRSSPFYQGTRSRRSTSLASCCLSESESNKYIVEASAPKKSLSELLIPAGYVQIGRPDTGDFDAICFDLSRQAQNREYRVVRVDHEDILCNWKVRVTGELWPSFIKLVESALSSDDPQVYYEEPIK